MAAYNYAHLAANGTTNPSTNPCTLHTVTINSKGASSNVLTLKDGASGATVAIIDTTAQVQTLVYDMQMQNGINAVMGTGTAADVTITFG